MEKGSGEEGVSVFKSFLFLVFSFLMIVSFSSFAVIVEPYFGIPSGTFKVNYLLSGQENTKEWSTKGQGFGLRLGTDFGPFYLAADYAHFVLEYHREDDSSVGDKTDKNSMFGAIFGWNLPVLPLRVWGGYNFMDHLNIGVNDAYHGSSMKLGGGLVLASFTINLEYIRHTYVEHRHNYINSKYPFTLGNTTYDSKPVYNSVFFSLGYIF